MKYIRTKDKIIGYEKIFETSENLSQLNIDGKIYDKFDWAVQGDTIDELCDCLMFVYEAIDDFLITEVEAKNMTYYDNETCYGCIKVKLPNGAIRIEPVAKLNENGDMVLI